MPLPSLRGYWRATKCKDESVKGIIKEMTLDTWIPLCNSLDIKEGADGGLAVPFDVQYAGQTCRAFAIRYQGKAHAYLNRCSHVAMELDWQPNRVFDNTGQWLICASHGAHYEPDTGACVGGPCKGGLVSIGLVESDGVVHWQTTYNLKPLEF